MNKLLVGAWILFAVDLVFLLLMVRELATADLGSDSERAYAAAVTWGFAAWLCAINLVLVISWWRNSHSGLWIAIVGGALPLLWVWTAAVQAITDAASVPR